MRSVTSLFTIYGIFAMLLCLTTACSSSRRVSKGGDDDSGSWSDLDGGTSSDSDGETSDDYDGGEKPRYIPPDKETTGGRGGSAGSTGGDWYVNEDDPYLLRCDNEGYCYWSDGHYCDSSGTCCYPDGHCDDGEVGDGGSTIIEGTGGGSAVGVAGTTSAGTTGIVMPPFFPGSSGGITIDPDDFTKEPWDPPIDDLAEPRWKNSGTPLCTEMQNEVVSQSVWSDSRGVYVLASGAGNGDYQYEFDPSVLPPGMPMPPPGLIPPIGTCVGEGCPRIEIYFNDGAGWRSVYEEDLIAPFFGSSETQITGINNGPLLMFGAQDFFSMMSGSSACGLATIENGEKTCESISYVEDVFVVNNNLAYAIYQGDVIRYNGSSWGPLPGVLSDNSFGAIWADETYLFGAMNGAGRIGVLHNGAWELLDTGTLEEFSALWGFSETDLWAGTFSGSIFHCDGETCRKIPWEGDNCSYGSEIGQIWGSDGTVYFYTASSIARIVDSEVEVLASFPCPDVEDAPRITSLWGNGPNEVFFTIIDESFPRRECGVTYVVWFDGTDFHQF